MPGWVLGVDVRESSVAAAVGAAGRVEAVEFGDGWELSAPESGGAPLREVAARAGWGQAPGGPERLVLAVPAEWGAERTDALRAAAAEAGLPESALVIRPVAAAWHLASGTMDGQLVAVVDAGASRIDVALLERTRRGFELRGQPRRVVIPGGQEPAAGARRAAAELAALMAEAGVPAHDLSGLHVTGPASRDPAVTRAIAEGFWIQPRPAPNPITATACGAVELVLTKEPVSEPRSLRRSRPLPLFKGAIRIGACGLIAVAAAGLVFVFLVPHKPGTGGTRADSTIAPAVASGAASSAIPAIATGSASTPDSSPASRPSPAPPGLRPGVYRVDHVIGIAGNWATTVASVKVANSGETTFIIAIKNTGVGGQLSCAESSSPLHASITYLNGNVMDSVAAYCPDYPDQALIEIPQGSTLEAYAVFANSRGLGQPFTFDWIGPDGLNGTLRYFTISR